MRALAARALLVLLASVLGGCSTLAYYGHLARGQSQVLRAREPIPRIVEDPQRDPELRRRLARVLQLRRWAVERLGLPDNGSYTTYAKLDRPYVVWNVFATPELSLEPVSNCFLLVGCLAYRGYYDRDAAERRAATLRQRGYDVHLGGVPAYSTLSWFEDPVLSTMLRGSDDFLLGTILHELAHQQLFVQGDTAFNESFAEFVEDQGLAQYLDETGGDAARWRTQEARRHQFTELVLALRARLETVYRSELPDADKRSAKQREFARLREDYQRLRDGAWGGDARFDGWFQDGTPNNARLLPFALYDRYKPAFAALFAREGGDWQRFYEVAERLGGLPEARRRQALEALLPGPAG